MKKLIAILVGFLLLTAATPEKRTTIFIIGDSTAAKKDLSTGSPERGWGMALQDYFTDPIVVDNHAVNGRSSLSFYNEGRWAKVLEKMQPGDYVIIQFGHNDEKPAGDRHTEARSTFQWMLERYVRETRERGGIPILMNCVVRRNYTLKVDGKAEDEALRNTTLRTLPRPSRATPSSIPTGSTASLPVWWQSGCTSIMSMPTRLPTTSRPPWARKAPRSSTCGISPGSIPPCLKVVRTIPTTTSGVPIR